MDNGNRRRRTVLVATADRAVCDMSTAALEQSGFRTLAAYSGYSAEYVLQHHDIDVVVIDGKIVAADPPKRPIAILWAYPKFRFVITNAALLSGWLSREILSSKRGTLLDGSELHAIVRAVERVVVSQ